MNALSFRFVIKHLTLGVVCWLICSCGNDNKITYNDTPLRSSTTRTQIKYDAKEVIENGRYGRSPYNNYDLFMPDGWEDEKPPPLLVFAHPGGFIMGDKSDYLIRRMCKEFARLGYATATINYQLIDVNPDNFSHQQRKSTLMKAVADARQAVQFIQQEHNFRPEETIFIGYSAGGFIANHIVFTDENEMLDYTDHSDRLSSEAFRQPAPMLLKGAVSIAGGVFDFSHLNDQDVRNISLLLIHGTDDNIVPYFRGPPFEKIVNQGVDVKLPGLYYELGGSYDGNDFAVKIGKGMSIDADILKLIRNWIFPDELCGSACVADEYNSKSNVQLIEVENGPHTLMHNSDKGDPNQTYANIKRKIHSFVRKCVSQKRLSKQNDNRDSSQKKRSNRY